MTIISKYSNLTQRIVTALVGVAVIITCVVYNPWTYFLIFFVTCFLTLFEFYGLALHDGMIVQKTYGMFCGMSIFCLSFLIEMKYISYRYYFVIFPLLAVIFLIKLYKKSEKKPFTNIAYTLLGIIYVSVPFGLINIITFEDGFYNFEIVFGCLFILWACDSGSFIAGSLFGKMKLFERISPMKSWEGAFGGAIFAYGFALLMNNYFHSLALWQWLCVATIMIVGTVYGDLVESLLKRSISIKDSGTSLPGHGGFLDRFDGLLISSPFIVAFLEIF